MIRATQYLLTSLLGLALASSAFGAEEATWFGQKASGKWMIGVKGGTVKNGNDEYNDANNGGILLGYQFARPIGFDGSAAIEFEGTSTFDDGDYSGPTTFGTAGTWDVDTLALFFAYRTPGTVYFKGRLGGMQSDVTSASAGTTLSEDDVSLAGSAGLGVKIGEWGNIELEWTGDSGDNDIGIISLGGVLQF
jgi:hypothetical protein